jgi:hypothetical protein
MYYYGNAFEKAWLSCAVSLGYASEDFLELETEKIANLIKEARDKKTRLHRIYRQDQNKNQCSTKMHPDCRSHKQFRRISEDS